MNYSQNKTNLSKALHDWASVFARRSMHDFLTYTREYGLAMQHINILMQLFYHGPTSILSVRRTMLGSKAAATQLIDKLVQMGLVERSEDPNDRRVKDIQLTAAGIKLVEESVAARKKWIDDLAASISPSDHEALVAALVQLTSLAVAQEPKFSHSHSENLTK